MKKFIAFDGNGNSGIQTKDKALDWARDRMSKNTAVTKVHIAEVIETAERVAPAIETKSFFCELNEPVAKAAA